MQAGEGSSAKSFGRPQGRRVLFVIPGPSSGPSMIFSKRQVTVLASLGVVTDIFYLASRTSPFKVAVEALRLRRQIARFQPDLVHAQFGTATGALCALVSSRPIVVTFRGSDLVRARGDSWARHAGGLLLSQIAAWRA